MAERFDAIVVGSGPNGLAAGITLARAGRSVRLYEAKPTIGGGMRTGEVTLPGFHHDICSAVHPLALSSPFFREAQLERHGLEWCEPEVQLAHPLDDGTAATVVRSLNATARGLGEDALAYHRLMRPYVRSWDDLMDATLGPMLRFPRHPLLLSRFGLTAIQSASGLASRNFEGERARALIAGVASHATLPLEDRFTASFAIMLGAGAHAVGWPVARGGSQSIAEAMARAFTALGGEIVTSHPVASIEELPSAGAYLFDVTPTQLLSIAGDRFDSRYTSQLTKFKRGAGIFKLDYALSGPVPWLAESCHRAATVHLGGTLEEVALSEHEVGEGRVPEKPFVIVVQQSVADPTRAPEGQHTLWAYCHVPNGCDTDMTGRIERQIERFAPGFKDLVLARTALDPAALESHNANYLGGDIAGGSHAGLQLFFRPALRWDPYATSDPSIFICSSSTPPGAGVHGMCGYHAAQSAMSKAKAPPRP